MFADKYLKKNNNELLIMEPPNANLGLIVVIPCLREPKVIDTLESIKKCSLSGVKAEVIVIVNHSEIADVETQRQNNLTKQEITAWIESNKCEHIIFYIVGPVVFKKKWAGVGLARKKGMDEAIRRFNLLEKENGIIISLDADTLVESNYLQAIVSHFKNHPKQIAATIPFEHQKNTLQEKQKQGIELYELYLSYYKTALDYAGYPYSMFTIGSAFAVTARAYVKRGGMNRRQAGEDFYFLQNLVQIGEIGEIKATRVYPSARLSDRVPFGTGPVLQKWMDNQEDLTKTYNLDAFVGLKTFFDNIDDFYKITEAEFDGVLQEIPKSISDFIKESNFWSELSNLNKNCSTRHTFKNRFFQIFNAFKILKFLNYAHDNGYYEKADLLTQFENLHKLKSDLG